MRYTYFCSLCHPPPVAVPQDRCSSRILVCWHTGAHSHAPLCYTGQDLWKTNTHGETDKLRGNGWEVCSVIGYVQDQWNAMGSNRICIVRNTLVTFDWACLEHFNQWPIPNVQTGTPDRHNQVLKILQRKHYLNSGLIKTKQNPVLCK